METKSSDLVITYKMNRITQGFYTLGLNVNLNKEFLKQFNSEDGIIFLTEYLYSDWGYKSDSISDEYRSIQQEECYIVKGFNEAELTKSICSVIKFIHCQLAQAIECKHTLDTAKTQSMSSDSLPPQFEFNFV